MANIKQKIEKEKYWLFRYDGLGLMTIINRCLEKYKQKIPTKDIIKFNKGLDLLRKTGFPEKEIEKTLNKKTPNGIQNMKLVYVNDEWSPVNKLNTNYSALAELLEFLIKEMINDPDDNVKKFGNKVYNTILDNTREGLLKLKPKLENIVNYYLKTLDDFLQFTGPVVKNSEIGEMYENKAVDFLVGKGFDVVYQGGDGDFIDMLFGCDLIVYREDVGYKSIQVKAYKPKSEDIDHYLVNWVMYGDNKFINLDKKRVNENIITKFNRFNHD